MLLQADVGKLEGIVCATSGEVHGSNPKNRLEGPRDDA
jgi:hypothetical protein